MEYVIQMLYYMIALMDAFILLRAYNRGSALSKKLSLAMLMNFFMIVFYSLNLSGLNNLVLKSFGCSLAFISANLMLLFYFDFILSYIGWQERIPKTFLIVVAGYILLDAIFLLINPFNQIALSYVFRPFGDSYLLAYVPKLPFHFHTIFDTIMIFSMILLLVMKCFEVPSVYYKRYFGPIFGMLMVVAIHLVYLNGIMPFDMDPTPVLYVFVGFLLYFYTFDYLPGVTLGITRQMIMQHLRDPIILFDYEDQMADHSSDMETMMPDVSFTNGTLTLQSFLEAANFSGMGSLMRDQEFDWVHEQDGKNRIYQCSYCVMKDEHDKLIGKLFMFHDVTDVRNAYFELENSMMFDMITGFYNKQSLYTQFPQWNNPEYWPVSIAVLNVDGMGALNEAYGTDFGDAVMRESARYIRRRVGNDVFCAKSDNGDIVVILEKTNNADAGDMMEAVRSEILDFYDNMPVSIEFGVATKDSRAVPVEKVMQNARLSMQNKKMLKDKSASSSLVDSLKQTLCESDYQTEEHVERTRLMSARLGRKMGLEDAEIGKLELIAVLHDIGKVAIPQNIIKKQGKLTEEERKIIEQHTVKGYRIAKSSPELSAIAEGILCHHEKWDGTGYPNGYKGEEIPLIARIISAVDSHDVMVNDRPYHKAMPERDAILELRRCSGTQFDPYVVEVFTDLLEKEELPKQEGEGATMDNPPADYVPRVTITMEQEPLLAKLPTPVVEQEKTVESQTEKSAVQEVKAENQKASSSEQNSIRKAATILEKATSTIGEKIENNPFKKSIKSDGSAEGMRALIRAKLMNNKDESEEQRPEPENVNAEVETVATASVEPEAATDKWTEEELSKIADITRMLDAVSAGENTDDIISEELKSVEKSLVLEEPKRMETASAEPVIETAAVETVAEVPVEDTPPVPTLFRMRDDIVAGVRTSNEPPKPAPVASSQAEIGQQSETGEDGASASGGIKVSSLRIAQ